MFFVEDWKSLAEEMLLKTTRIDLETDLTTEELNSCKPERNLMRQQPVASSLLFDSLSK
jgi:hypothetical protein